MGRPKNCPYGGSGPHLVHGPQLKLYLDQLSDFAELTTVTVRYTDRQTDRQTNRPHYSVCIL